MEQSGTLEQRIPEETLSASDDQIVAQTVPRPKRAEASTHNLKTRRRAYRADFLAELTNPQHYGSLVDPNATLLDQIVAQEQWPANIGNTLKRHCLAPESIYQAVGYKVKRNSRSPKKAEVINLSTNLLQIKLLLQLRNVRDLFDGSLDESSWVRDTLRLDMRKLEAEHASLYEKLQNAKQAAPDLTGYLYKRRKSHLGLARWDQTQYHEPVTLNQQLSSNFLQTKGELRELSLVDGQRAPKDDIPTVLKMLAKTVDLLNSSKAAPDLTTYNVLIAGFSDFNLKSAVDNTIKTLRQCHLRPNEVTVSTVLQHYHKYGDREGFNHWIDIFNGQYSGLALSRHKSIERSHLTSQLMAIPGQPDRIIQLQRKSPKVFEAVIAGTIHFDGLDTALEKCRSEGAHSWGISMHSLGPLLRACADRGDSENGAVIWSMLRELEVKANYAKSMTRRQKPEPIPKHVFAAMLDLCSRTQDTKTYAEVSKHAQDVWPGEMQSILSITRQNKFQEPSEPSQSVSIVDRSRSTTEQETSAQEGLITPDADDSLMAEPRDSSTAKRHVAIAARWQDYGLRSWSELPHYDLESQPAERQHMML